MSLFSELKKRNVFRVGAAYVVSAWVILQVADLVLDSIEAPSWVMQSLLLGLGIGFIVALVIAWAYELTPDGVKKEKDVVRDESITHVTAKKLDYITLAGVLLVVGLFAYQQSKPTIAHIENVTPALASAEKKTENPITTETRADSANAMSIAVLPFVNMSSDAEQEYFSDGITEEILNALAKIKQLKVAGRTSSFSFKGKNDDLRAIADILGVAHILEGSVRKAGTQVRITAQLIKAADGFHMWSETYDGSLENIFDLQENISRKVSDELKVVMKIQDGTPLASKMTSNIDAYDLFLRGREHVAKRLDDNIPKGIALLEQAVELDPQFAEAWAVLGEAEAVIGPYMGYTSLESQEADQQARTHINTAIALDPTLVLPYAVRGLLKVNVQEQDFLGAVNDLQKALELDPNNVLTLRWLGAHYQSLGYFEKAYLLFEHAFELEPLSRTDAFNLFSNKVHTGSLEAAKEYSKKVNALTGVVNDEIVAYILSAQGDNQAAIELFMQLHQQEVERQGASELITRDEAEQFAIAVFGGTKAMKKSVQTLEKLFINGPDDSFDWQLRLHIALENNDRVFEILYSKPEHFIQFAPDFMWFDLPAFKALRQDPRFAAMLEHFGLPKAWNKLGWPEVCKPNEGTDGSNGQFSCD